MLERLLLVMMKFLLRFLKHTATTISLPLKYIDNISLKRGNFSQKLKYAKVLALFKSGNSCDINYYRAISILLAFSKFFEKVITTRLVNFIERNSLTSDYQHGLRSGRSTETAILQFDSNVYKYLEETLFGWNFPRSL